MNAYSEDFRKKVVEYKEAGDSKAETERMFSVCRESINCWLKLKEEGKSLKPVATPRSPHKLNREELKKYIEEHPEAMQKEMAEHFGCVPTTVSNALKAMGYTRKKKTIKYRERDEKKR